MKSLFTQPADHLQRSPEAQVFLTMSNLSVGNTLTDACNSDRSVADTVKLMGEIIKTSATHPIVLYTASSLAQAQPTTYLVQKLSQIFSFIQSHVKFVQDERVVDMGRDGAELLIRPELLLSMPHPQGDCDDFTMLAGALVLASGVLPEQVKIVTIAANPQIPRQFTHVFLRVYWYDKEDRHRLRCENMDCSHGMYCGWIAERYYRIQEWNL